jgi:activator of HSP90 ATPase
METRDLKQQVTFKAGPHVVYEIIMDSKKHSILAGDTAKISRKAGGKFTVGDYIEGVNVEIVPDEKIVQTWRYNDWPEGHYSRATFSFKGIPGCTRFTFIQTGIPADFYEDIKQGWIDYYWTPMKEMLEK